LIYAALIDGAITYAARFYAILRLPRRCRDSRCRYADAAPAYAAAAHMLLMPMPVDYYGFHSRHMRLPFYERPPRATSRDT